MEKRSLARVLTESAIMIALATVLSIIKIVDLPYGGSVTVASMLPIAIIAYRYGLGWGLGSGLVYGVIQQLLGLKNLTYVSGFASVLALILLDYIIAFAVIGFAGVFRKVVPNQATSMTYGVMLACALRYICHVISGATVWAGLSVPTAAALGYSFIYNATYMIPETLVTLAATFYICSSIDFTSEMPRRIIKEKSTKLSSILLLIGKLVATVALIFDIAAIFAHLQDADTGEFTITNISEVNWLAVIIVTCVAAVIDIVFTIVSKSQKKSN